MTRQERSICYLWDSLREKHPRMRDQALMARAVERYRREFHDDITADEILAALEARANA